MNDGIDIGREGGGGPCPEPAEGTTGKPPVEAYGPPIGTAGPAGPGFSGYVRVGIACRWRPRATRISVKPPTIASKAPPAMLHQPQLR